MAKFTITDSGITGLHPGWDSIPAVYAGLLL